ncbi:hypothetical protein TRIATDRAFT_302057 [Trichoderma atroviride IMI 206040]|uniref:DNA-directed RNA polymerase II subunit RPB9-like zinc ribbon domain-containing protein n=1 Tax=Hypocrea atroviridis (strain ATCC 20476 / IMI 206040) TaxID=452589 RepID=G9P7A9_HYPAI|nr:uncharacterized protein TRIATDRAFT_302057 [Trichoderma atroviride IMI 206040]EHK41558.1 hypothetical protein TRIATDRAFT_302057 [Trichoderma atroviride IMI 206040]
MATPQSTASFEASGPKKLEQITFRFCSECSNMLYPKEDEDAHKLQFTCRTCQYTEDAQSTCVFRNVLNNSSGETAGVTQDVGSDPTVSTTASDFVPVLCLGCGVVVYCDTCREPSTELSVARDPDHAYEDEFEHLGNGHFSLPLPADPFDEYDEELMEDVESTGSSDMSDFAAAHSDDNDYNFHNDAMAVDL